MRNPYREALQKEAAVEFSEDAYDAMRRFYGLHNQRNPGILTRTYSNLGNRLMNERFVVDGKALPATEFIESMRDPSTTVGGLLDTLKLAPEYTPESVKHYAAFKESPNAAYAQLLREHGYDEAALRQTRDWYKTLRWKALQDLAKQPGTAIQPSRKVLAQRIAQMANATQKFDRSGRRHVLAGATRNEALLHRADPAAYDDYNRRVLAAIRNKSVPEMSNLDAVKERLFQTSGLEDTGMPTAVSRGLSKRPAFTEAFANASFAPHLREATGPVGYGKIYFGMKALHGVNRLRHFGQGFGKALAGVF